MESNAGLIYLAIAYGVFFVILFAYVLRLRRRDLELAQQLRQLRELDAD